MDAKHAVNETRAITGTANLLPISKKYIVFPPNYTVNNEHFNAVKAGDMFSLTPKLVEADDDMFLDDADFKKNACTYTQYLDRRYTSCILLQMVKDGVGVRHTGMSKDDTEEARKEKLKAERAAAKLRKRAAKAPVPAPATS